MLPEKNAKALNNESPMQQAIVADDPEDSFILWHDLEAERHELKRVIPGVVDIYGSQDMDVREQAHH